MRTLNATGKTEKKALRQAGRWFKKNPNRKHINLKMDAKTIYIKREDLISKSI